MNGKQQFEDFLSELHNEKTITANRFRIKKFLEVADITLEDLAKLSAKDARHLMLTTQSRMVEMGIANNSILGYMSVIRNFFDFLGKPITRLKGKLVDKELARGFHVFGNGDLIEMFNHGSIRSKALLAVSTSLGWEISSIADMDRQEFEDIINKATSENQQYIFYMTQRKKTGAPRLAVLNPLAVEWLDKWLKASKKKNYSTVFGIDVDQINNVLRRMVKQSGIKTTGRIRFHNLRAWTMSSLSKSGFNEFQIKFVMGKSINSSDATYLRRLQSEIEEKYPEVYERYLSLQPSISEPKTLALAEENKALRETVKTLLEKIDKLEHGLNYVSTDFSERLDWLENRAKKKEKVKFEG